MPDTLLPFKNLIGLTFVLCLPILIFWIARLTSAGWARDPRPAGRLGITLVLFVTSSAHFFATELAADMLPDWVPFQLTIVYATGVLEFALALALHVPGWRRQIGIVIAAMLLVFLPANIYAAINNLPFGGNVLGPEYLVVRVPYQFILIAWVLWASGVYPVPEGRIQKAP